MNNGLNEVISAAIQGIGRNIDVDAARRQASLLRLAEAKRSDAMIQESTATVSDETIFGSVVHRGHWAADVDKDNGVRSEVFGTADRAASVSLPGISVERRAARLNDALASNQKRAGPIATPTGSAGEHLAATDAPQKPRAAPPRALAQVVTGDQIQLGPDGFHSALMERVRRGEALTEREELLVTVARKDFASLRPFVIGMTLDRLNALVNAPDLTREVAGADAPGALEVFAVATLRSLGHRANNLLQEDGPDAALSLFGEIEGEHDPLAIFQRVFTTALDLVEVFERSTPSKAKLLARLAEALDSEVEKI